ncbi:hypothetical protein, partial [Tractidigestivibacter sp.]|uniref:hypothetical protein n=1 Tax=Tractidigestivibacter sp. TaxID=2847320 RepID=UPI003FD78B86
PLSVFRVRPGAPLALALTREPGTCEVPGFFVCAWYAYRNLAAFCHNLFAVYPVSSLWLP